MIKVFLVEDEIIIRNGIKNSINWERTVLIGKCMDMTLSERQVMENLRYR